MLGRSSDTSAFSPAGGSATGSGGWRETLFGTGKRRTDGNNPFGPANPPPPPPRRSRFVIKPSRKSCIALGALTGGVIVASAGVYFLQTGQINDLATQVHQKQSDLANSEKIARDLEIVTAENARTRDQLRFLETSVTQSEYVPSLLHQTQELAQSTKLRVGSLRPTSEPAPPPPADKDAAKKFVAQPYDKLHVDMDLTGHYWDVAQMLYRLTQFPKIMTVESVEMNGQNGGTPGADRSQLSIKLRLTGFIFKSDDASAKGGAAAPTLPGGAKGVVPPPGKPATPPVKTASGSPANASVPVAAKV